MKIYFVRRKDDGAYLEWNRVVQHWVFSREEATLYRDEAANETAETLTLWDDTPCEVEEIDVNAGLEAIKILAEIARLYHTSDISGAGPNGTAWVTACARAEQLLSQHKSMENQ